MQTDIVEGKRKKKVPSEAALLLALIILGASLVLLAKSQAGMMSTALISYTLSQVLPQLTYGTWVYIVYTFIIVMLIIVMRRVKPGYFISFVLAALVGAIIDGFDLLLAELPVSLVWRCVYFFVAFWGLAFTIYVLNHCKLPTLPVETFTRDITMHFHISFAKLRTVFDMTCIVIAAAVSLIIAGRIIGIGVGTIILAFIGMAVTLVQRLVERHIVMEPRIKWLERLSADGKKDDASTDHTAP